MTAMLDGEVYGGLTLCKATVDVAQDLGLYDPDTAYKARQGATALQVRHVSQLTAWALFNYITYVKSVSNALHLIVTWRPGSSIPPCDSTRLYINLRLFPHQHH